MHKIVLITFLILFTLSEVQADGPPVKKDGTITTDCFEIKLDTEQIKQVEVSHIVELTINQHKLLKKFYKKIPKKFVVVTPHYNDCTCGLIYLIWNKKDTVVLPIDEVSYIKELLENKDYPYDYNDLINNWTRGTIIIDTKGNMYYERKKIDKIKLKALFLKISKSKDQGEKWIHISLPPYLNTDFAQKVENIVEEIENIADKHQVKTAIGG